MDKTDLQKKHFTALRLKYQELDKYKTCTSDEFLYMILRKVDLGIRIIHLEFQWLKDNNLVRTIEIIRSYQYQTEKETQFTALRVRYQQSDRYKTSTSDEFLYMILRKVDLGIYVTGVELQWLKDNSLLKTIEIIHRYQYQTEEEKRLESEFLLELRNKYNIPSDLEISNSSPIYSILYKLNRDITIMDLEIQLLYQCGCNETIYSILGSNGFLKPKRKYKITNNTSHFPTEPVYTIPKKSQSKNQFKEAQNIYEQKKNGNEDHFRLLKAKYHIVGQLAVDPFYEIMLKIEQGERLDPKQVVQLIEEGRLSRDGKIAIAYYRLEAIFYEKEYQRTGNRWNLPSASANWRKADEPEQALKVTENINWSKVKESDLKSALWVTRGAAFRDLMKLDEAENYANQAIECQPNNHKPYTLIGAICYDRGQYIDGDKWFSMAIERGADDTDDEIKRIVRMTKDKEKRREVIEYLLKKDKKLYAWANSYLKE